ncbi:MFS general substrate transporter [Lichtheimia hyalospora FSU 10163]|nr:MFS general substrate transporter [Lichtheimia hyalospora FSU 10163]
MSEIGTEFEKAHLATWIHNSYVLACMTTLPLAGKLADLFGRKPVLVVLTLLFLLGSFGCGIADSLVQIIVARAIAGFGGGGVTLMANVVIHDVVPIDKRSQYQSFISMVQTLGIAVGSPLGGFITDTLGWRYCFKLNIIPLLFNAYVYFFRLNNYRTPSMANGTKVMDQLRSIDFLGVILLSTANVLLVTSFLFGGNTYDWDDPLIICLLTGSALIFVLFALYQMYGTQHPLISHVLATNRNAMVTCAGMIFMCICESGLTYSLPQFFMGVLGFTTSESGLWTMAEALVVPVGCFTAGQYIRRTGYFKKFMIVIGVLYVLGCGLSSQWMIRAIPFFVGMTFVIIQGFSYGAILVSLFMSVASDIAASEMASAMSIAVLFRYMGFSLGPASVAAIVQGNLKSLLTKKITGSDAEEVMILLHACTIDA